MTMPDPYYRTGHLGPRYAGNWHGWPAHQSRAPIPSLGADALEVLWSPTARAAGGIAMAYHGYKRTGSTLWALAWAVAGGITPPITSAIAVAQGFGKRK